MLSFLSWIVLFSRIIPGGDAGTIHNEIGQITSVKTGSWLFGQKWYHPANAFDGNHGTNWIGGKPGDTNCWIEAQLDSPRSVGKIVLRDPMNPHNPAHLRLIFSDGQQIAYDFPKESIKGRKLVEIKFAPIRTSKVRIHIERNYTGLSSAALSEIEIFELLEDGTYRQLTYEGPEVQELHRRRSNSLRRLNETRNWLTQRRAHWDLEVDERYRTTWTVDRQNQLATVSKQPWSITWSLATGTIHGATIKGNQFEDAELCSFSIVDRNGQRFSQKSAPDGQFEAHDSKFQLVLNGQFTPTTADGSPFPSKFTSRVVLHKLSGLIEVRYRSMDKVTGIRQVRIRNTLGSGSRNHNQLYTYPYYPGIMTVAGHGEGLQCHLLDWNDDFFSPKMTRLLVHQMEDRCRGIDVLLANVTNQTAISFDPNHEFNYAFSLLPVRAQPPFRPIWCHPWNGMPWCTGKPFGDRDRRYIERYSAKHGPTYFIIGAQWPIRITQRPEDLAKFIDHAHATGNKVMIYMDARWNNPDRVCFEGDLSWEEMRDARMQHELDNGLSLGSTAWRNVLLDWYRRLFSEFSIDAIYIDSVNEDNDLPKPTHGNVLGVTRFLSDLRIIVDELTNDRIIVLHMLGQDSTPHVALADYMLPGEHLANQMAHDIKGLHLQYNPFLYGCQHIAYSARSYDQSHPHVVNQLLSYPLSPWLCTFLEGPDWAMGSNEPQSALDAYHIYRKPVFDFCKAGLAAVHHALDGEPSKWLRVTNPAVSVLGYSKGDQALIVVTTEDSDPQSSELRIKLTKLGLVGEGLVLSDQISGRQIAHRVEGDWLVIPEVSLRLWPRLFRIAHK